MLHASDGGVDGRVEGPSPAAVGGFCKKKKKVHLDSYRVDQPD